MTRLLVLFGLVVAACTAEVSSTQTQADTGLPGSCQANMPDPRACDPSDTKKTTVCHIPPGNPANAHTICIGNAAVQPHLDHHGDFLGTCSCPGAGSGGGGGSGTGSGGGSAAGTGGGGGLF